MTHSLEDLSSYELRWEQTSWSKMDYALWVDNESIASLHFRNWFNTQAEGRYGDGLWIFNRPGFWQKEIEITDGLTGAVIAHFIRHIWRGGGEMELGYGRKILVTTNFMQTRVVFSAESGEALLKYNLHGFLRHSIYMNIEPRATEWPELPWLVLLGCYVVATMQRDAAAAAA